MGGKEGRQESRSSSLFPLVVLTADKKAADKKAVLVLMSEVEVDDVWVWLKGERVRLCGGVRVASCLRSLFPYGCLVVR